MRGDNSEFGHRGRHGMRDGTGHGGGHGHGPGEGRGGKGFGHGKGPGMGMGRGRGAGFGRGADNEEEHGHGRGRSPIGRLIAHGNLHLLILHLIREQPRHGYDTIRTIEEMTGSAYVPSPGTIYPAFSMLEDQGFIAPEESEGSKKSYAVTDEGKAYLDENADALKNLLERIEKAAKNAPAEAPEKIVKAMKKLKSVLGQRLEQGSLSEEDIARVAGALDAAAKDIEGS